MSDVVVRSGKSDTAHSLGGLNLWSGRFLGQTRARARARDFLLAHNPRDSIRHRNSPRAHILETVRDPFMAFSGGLYAAARRD